MAAYEDFEPNRVRHLELIQAVVARLGNDAFLMKGWALTVAGAFFGFAINKDDWRLALAGLLPTVAFWGLDAYFLRCERLFRHLYSRVRAQDPAITPFFMGATGRGFAAQAGAAAEDPVPSWGATVWSGTVLAFYGLIFAAALLIVVLLVCHS